MLANCNYICRLSGVAKRKPTQELIYGNPESMRRERISYGNSAARSRAWSSISLPILQNGLGKNWMMKLNSHEVVHRLFTWIKRHETNANINICKTTNSFKPNQNVESRFQKEKKRHFCPTPCCWCLFTNSSTFGSWNKRSPVQCVVSVIMLAARFY